MSDFLVKNSNFNWRIKISKYFEKLILKKFPAERETNEIFKYEGEKFNENCATD